MSTKKRCTTWELWVKLYLGQNEDCILEAASQIALRDCSKAAVVESQYKVLLKGEFNTIKHSFYKNLLLVRGPDVNMKRFSAFLDMRRYKDSVQFSSLTQLCLTVCDPMNCSTPGLTVLGCSPHFVQIKLNSQLSSCMPFLVDRTFNPTKNY